MERSPDSSAWKLRWRAPSDSPSGMSGGNHPFTTRFSAGGDRSGVTNSQVHQAGQLSQIDPFDDPFGDRAGTGKPGPQGTRMIAQPAPQSAAQQPGTSENPTLPRSEVPPAEPATPEQRPGVDAPPALPEPYQMPEKFGPPADNDADCDRVYNRRNCCTENDRCVHARRKVRADRIVNISLDITPSFTNTDPSVSTEIVMSKTLADAPSRTWKDRTGSVVATGRLVDYRNGRVHIATSEGEVEKIPFKNLSDDDLCFVTAWWSLPTECPLGDEEYAARQWLASDMTWKASALCHKPLYFEEVALERYGHTAGPVKEPFVAAAHFFGNLVTLPYQMGMHPPHECQYVLGYYRPGNCAPWLVPPLPLSIRGGLSQAGAVLGGVYVIP